MIALIKLQQLCCANVLCFYQKPTLFDMLFGHLSFVLVGGTLA